MNELTDLELCKRVADIEGVDVEYSEEFNALFRVKVQHGLSATHYNPLTNKALLFDLMVKYKHLLDMDDCFMYVKDSMIPRAILECIVEANQ